MNKIYTLRWAKRKYADFVVVAGSANAARKFVVKLTGDDEWLDINETYAQILGTASGTYANTIDPILIART